MKHHTGAYDLTSPYSRSNIYDQPAAVEGLAERYRGRGMDMRMARDLLTLRDAGMDTADVATIDLLFDRAEQRGARARKVPEEACVYFIRNGGHVKIGFSTRGAEARFRSMQLPPESVIAAVIPNSTQQREAELHRMFAATRVHGEWFSTSPELEALIRAWAV